jgi:hypothetical protein
MSQPKSRVALSLITAIASLSFGGGAYAQSPPAPTDKMTAPAPERSKVEGEVPPPTMDTNEDGKADAWDRDANGVPDAWDNNGDAKPDLFDNDGDGKPDDKAAKPAPKPER